MKKFVGYERGMGIGGWLTNYKRFNVLRDEWRYKFTVGDMEHFATYITEEDVINIKSLGMDHIRLGFDQIVLEESPYTYREEIFSHIDRFVGWCKKHGINLVLNMHKAVGNYCDIKEKVELTDDAELQNRFIAMWLAFEKRYADEKDVVFELLNEVRKVDPEKWNLLLDKTIKALRELNPTRKIVVGSIGGNYPDTLKHLRIYEDENVIYTFHLYDPPEFTHQRGVLNELQLFYNRKMPWPGDIEMYRDFRRVVHGEETSYEGLDRMDIEYLRIRMKSALDFIEQHPDKILWCGEFGTIRHADIKWRENWMRDMITLLKEHDIPYCVWNYLSTPNDGNRFSLVDDDDRKILSEEMARIIRGEV